MRSPLPTSLTGARRPSRKVASVPDTSIDPVSSAVEDEELALIQNRLGIVYGVLGAILLALWALAATLAVATTPDHGLRRLSSFGRIGHLVMALALLAGYVVCRSGRRSRAMLSVLDLGGMALIGLLAGAAISFAPGFRVELMSVLAIGLTLPLRAALVPTPPRWTLLVAALSAIPAPIGTILSSLADSTWNATVVPRAPFGFIACAWTVASVVSSFAIARVMYGLRTEIRKVMKLGPYTLDEKIGEGGMGIVYRARHALLRRPTAVKILARDRNDPSSVWRFEREVQITSELTHPNTIAIYDFGRTRGGLFYYAMELLDGMTLQELVGKEGPLPPSRAIPILAQVVGALGEAHAAGLVHRDVKPSNIMLCERGGLRDFVKVLDFGLVKSLGVPNDPQMSRESSIKGTPLYMAPEAVLEPSSLDARADIYAVGAVAYFILTGRPPFEGSNIVEICSQHLHVPPVPPSQHVPGIAAELDALVLSCLAKAPKDRPASAAEILARLPATSSRQPAVSA
ncbi:MAG: hypothetical protein BGO98_44295 [Myxococcales bacterium 68-20]|nr:serine/threonine protein kinase [Myxococcales bacterium]OJY26943.1 MAG: hypothetical protein BGO98_44295 [Myxococcales bacterium 68-20]